MTQEVTAIFDIGKTNKKFFILDDQYNEIFQEYVRFDGVPDEDGFPTEDLSQLVDWIQTTFYKFDSHPDFAIKKLNFSTYGASLIHLDVHGNVITPFYNYLKPLPDEIEIAFFQKHGKKEHFESETSSPYLGMLNSGLQLFYLKYFKPELFRQIHTTLHFPQYLSSLFSQKYVADFTSLGCHTGLWDFNKNEYAKWVIDEGFDQLLAPLVHTNRTTSKGELRIGVGIHDSSSALIPYLQANEEPFVLISTGTWSICMNLFNKEMLSKNDLKADCLHFLDFQGLSVKASRLFLGDHLRNTVKLLAHHFQVDYESYKEVLWNPALQSKRHSPNQFLFDHSLLKPERFGYQNGNNSNFSMFETYHEAVHYLFDELTDLQVKSLRFAIGKSEIKKVFIDGGFSSSKVFTQFLANKLPEFEIYASSFPLGSTLGAALMVDDRKLPDNFMERAYKVRLIKNEKLAHGRIH